MPVRELAYASLTCVLWVYAAVAIASDQLETVEVRGRSINLVGETLSASQGLIGQQEIRLRPLLRTGEILELVPGMVVTQHSGTGKANQYFLRGFNLDHGTDFSTSVDGMPLNMRSHGHGQGYTDLNPIIPETIERIRYAKGPYYVDVGDFSGAGSAQISTLRDIDRHQLSVSMGHDQYTRALALGGIALGPGRGIYGLETNYYDGPWTNIREDLRKYNTLFRYTLPVASSQLSVTTMAYNNRWNSADQIPSRAVSRSLVGKLGSLDDTVGGQSSRYSFSAALTGESITLSAYTVTSDLSLWSNFTYYLEDPEYGDQFEQVDSRKIYGGEAIRRGSGSILGTPVTHRVGFSIRYDDIDEVGLHRTQARQRLGTVRSDTVAQLSLGGFAEMRWQVGPQVRVVTGLRTDYFDIDTRSLVSHNMLDIDLSKNNGGADESITSLNASLIYTVSDTLEWYGAWGQGFHSNDGRGVSTVIDPSNGESVEPVDPLVRSRGYEIGFRNFWRERLNLSAAIWSLELDSELLFVGDAGTTEASRASKRWGVELSAYYNMTEALTLDLEYAFTRAYYKERSFEGNSLPGALEHVLQAGVSREWASGWFGSVRLRYFGPRSLTESASVRSDASTVTNLRLGRKLGAWTLYADLLNVLDSRDHDIDYYYSSRLPNEPSMGVEDRHFHVLEPRTLRLSVAYQY